jgi:hypothetical protein
MLATLSGLLVSVRVLDPPFPDSRFAILTPES